MGLAHGELKIIAFNKRNYVWYCNNDSKFCSALNHLVIIGKYFLYVKTLNGKFYIFIEFVSLAHDKISLEKYISYIRLVTKKSSEQNGLFFRLF